MFKSSFRQRSPLGSHFSGSCLDIVDTPQGRSLVSLSVEEYNKKHELPPDDFTLTDQLQTGVPLKEIDTSHLIGSTDSIDHPVDTAKINEFVKNLPDNTKSE